MIDLTGKVFGRLTVLKLVRTEKRASTTHFYWLCECTCGNKKEVSRRYLNNGSTRSCGCLAKEHKRGGPQEMHGLSKERVYYIWKNMNSRCYNKSNRVYPSYGAKGVIVAWGSLQEFINDMGLPPEKDSSIDRIDPDGNYCKDNCRWISDIENKRRVRRSNK